MAERTGASDRLPPLDWWLWFWWVLANIVGWGVGGVMFFYILFIALMGFGGGAEAGAIIGRAIPGIIVGAVAGAVAGFLQWLVLRRQVKRGGWWILASAVGWAVTWAHFMGGLGVVYEFTLRTPGYELMLLMIGAWLVGGTVTGGLQWLVLRGQFFRAGWWLATSALSWSVGMVMQWPVEVVIMNIGLIPNLTQLFVVTGTVYGAITGTVLMWLLRQRLVDSDGAGGEAARAEAMGDRDSGHASAG